jgi:hypothetical protein
VKVTPLARKAPKDLARQHRAGGAVDIADVGRDLDLLARIERGRGLGDQLAVEHVVDRMRLALGPVGRFLRRVGLVEHFREVEPLGLPVRESVVLGEKLGLADDLVDLAVAHLGEKLAHFLGDEEEEVDDMLGGAFETLAQHRILRGDADRASVEVALAHHDAARRDQGRGREAELIGAQKRADDDVATGAKPAIDL